MFDVLGTHNLKFSNAAKLYVENNAKDFEKGKLW